MTQEKKYSVGTTSENVNNVQHIKISRKKKLFLLFWVAEEDKGKKFFSEAAQTRMKNIKKAKDYDSVIHKIHCPPLHKFSEIQEIIDYWINHYGGKNKAVVKEVGFFSHSGVDGPLIYSNPSYMQMPLNGWAMINFYWHPGNTRLNFFGCNSANNPNFAQNISNLSNCKNVVVGGQSVSSFPSFSPYKRNTSLARHWNWGWNAPFTDTYMVGTQRKKGKEALLSSVEAEPMRFYKNGVLLYERDQSFLAEKNEF